MLHQEHGIESWEATIGPAGTCTALNCTDYTVYAQPGNTTLSSGEDDDELLKLLEQHFASAGALPVLFDDGMYSYCLLGLRQTEDGVMEGWVGDPHRPRPPSNIEEPVGQLVAMGFSRRVLYDLLCDLYAYHSTQMHPTTYIIIALLCAGMPRRQRSTWKATTCSRQLSCFSLT